MNRQMMILSVVLAGCGGSASDKDLDAIAAASEGDVAEVARAVDALTASFAARSALIDVSDSFEGVGDCVWQWTLTGDIGDYAYSASIDPAPCGGGYTGERVTLDYAVTAGQLSGTVVKGTDVWDYSLTGSRTSDVTFQTARMDEPATYTADWSLDSLTGSTDGFSEGPFDASLTYTGWADGVWNLTVSRAADLSITGTLTGPEGSSCTLSGSSSEDVTASCDVEGETSTTGTL